MNAAALRNRVPILATTGVCLLLYAAAALRYDGFFSVPVLINLLQDNAFLGLAAIGMTFVILSGGIDLSVGAMIGLGSILIARLTMDSGWHPLAAIALVLVLGTLFGGGMGGLIHYFRLPPFLVTLGGMFLARGLAFMIDLQAISINHAWLDKINELGARFVPLPAVAFPAALVAALYLAHWTPFGRAIYAIGGGESSALLMGLPVGRVKVGIYALSGLCSAAASVLYTFYTTSGNPSAGIMLELDAIAAVVIGGTLLSGGVGHVFGTLIGVLILGIIQTAIAFEGTLNSWWTRIAIGTLLLAFILLQKLVQRGAEQRAT